MAFRRVNMKTLDANPEKAQFYNTESTSTTKMEAIACGVRVRFEDSTGYSQKVIDETVCAARALGLTNTEIEKWAIQRRNTLAHDTKRLKEIKTLLEKAHAIVTLSEAKR